MPRDHTLYFGQAAVFGVLGRFDLQAASLSTSFSAWASVEDFNDGQKPIGRLEKSFTVQRDAKFEFGEVVGQIEQRALEILGLGGRGVGVEGRIRNANSRVRHTG